MLFLRSGGGGAVTLLRMCTGRKNSFLYNLIRSGASSGRLYVGWCLRKGALIIESGRRIEGQAMFVRSWHVGKWLFARMWSSRFGTLLFLFLVHGAVSARTVTSIRHHDICRTNKLLTSFVEWSYFLETYGSTACQEIVGFAWNLKFYISTPHLDPSWISLIQFIFSQSVFLKRVLALFFHMYQDPYSKDFSLKFCISF
jgi:hypothetical protein